MKTLIVGCAAAAVVFLGGLALAGSASAQPLGGQPADVVVSSLQVRGYVVEINGDQNAPLSECTVTGVSGLRGSEANGQPGVPAGTTVHVGITCDDDYDE